MPSVDPRTDRADAWYNDMYAYDLVAAAWSAWEPRGGGPIPEPRSSACFAVSGDAFFIFGGSGTSGPLRAQVCGRTNERAKAQSFAFVCQ